MDVRTEPWQLSGDLGRRFRAQELFSAVGFERLGVFGCSAWGARLPRGSTYHIVFLRGFWLQAVSVFKFGTGVRR